MGEVQYLEDRVDDAAAGAAVEFRAVAERYVRMLIASHGEYRGPVHMSTDAADLAELAGTLLLDQSVDVRQAILEAEPISKRLETAVRAIGDSLKTIEANLMRGGPGRDPSTFGIN